MFMQTYGGFSYRKRVAVSIAAGAIQGQVAHGLALTPVAGRPNPSRLEGVNSWAATDGTNVYVNLDVAQLVPISFDVPLFL